MTTHLTRRAALGLVALASAAGLTACGGSSDPLATSGGASASASAASAGGSASGGSVVVGSANFPESQILMNIYAGALEAKGVKVSTKPNIGSRETYLPALEKGEVSIMPEYTGVLAAYYDKNAKGKTGEEVLAELKAALPKNLVALEPSKAEDKDSVVVTKETADKYSLKSIGDLAPHAGEMVLGGPPEWKTRQTGVPGLKADYGLTFKEFKPLEAGGTLTVQALKNGTVQAANLFTTDPQVKANGFVVLEDPKAHFTAQNVIPIAQKDAATDTVTSALNAVSAKLDTPALSELVKKVVIDHEDADAVAKDWLESAGLGG